MPGAGSLFKLLEVPVVSPSGARSISTLMTVDSGSKDNFNSHGLAEKLQHVGTPHTIFIHVLDQECKEKPTLIYHLDTMDMSGINHRLEAISINSPCPRGLQSWQALPRSTT